jgi:hypothetical protein
MKTSILAGAALGLLSFDARAALPLHPGPVHPIPIQPDHRVMLDEEGLVTPVKSQGSRNSCTVFASVGLIESEYKIRYGLTLDLSEQYLINMINENRPSDWIGGDANEKLLIASYYGLPPETAWPYVTESQILADEHQALPDASADDSVFGPLLWSDLFDRDVANYSRLIYPPLAAHEQARYAPLQVVNVPNPTLADSYEKILDEKHPITFLTATGAWAQQNATTFGYNAAGSQNIDHAILLVGYDHDKQLFRIKNSWGTGWADHGFADFTYELFLKTVTEPQYVSGVRDPKAPVMGNGVWRGFWRAEFQRQPGVAVIRHSYGGNAIEGLPVAGDFYADAGSTTALPKFLSGDDLTATFGDANGQPWFRLERKAGQNFAVLTDLVQGGSATWWKCNPANTGSYTPDTDPKSYPQTWDDPNVLPPCGK